MLEILGQTCALALAKAMVFPEIYDMNGKF